MEAAFSNDNYAGVVPLPTSSGKGAKIEFDRSSEPTAAPPSAPAAKDPYTNSPTIIFIGGASVIMILFCFFCSGHRSTAKGIELEHHKPTLTQPGPSAAGAETRSRLPTPAPQSMIRNVQPPRAPASNDVPPAAAPAPAPAPVRSPVRA